MPLSVPKLVLKPVVLVCVNLVIPFSFPVIVKEPETIRFTELLARRIQNRLALNKFEVVLMLKEAFAPTDAVLSMYWSSVAVPFQPVPAKFAIVNLPL